MLMQACGPICNGVRTSQFTNKVVCGLKLWSTLLHAATAMQALWDRMAKSAALVVASSLKHLQAELSDIRLLTPR